MAWDPRIIDPDPDGRPPAELLRELQAKLSRGLGRIVLFAALGGVALVGLLTTYAQVEPDEVGVILRLGRYMGTAEPGPHFRLPFWIDRIIKVPVQRQLKAEFGFRTARTAARTTYANSTEDVRRESLMLTGDLNVAVVEWIVQYKIADPYKYLFKVKNVEDMLRDISEASMRAVVGDHSVNEVLTTGRQRVAMESKLLLQELADRYETGVDIQQVVLQDVNPPDPVKPSFNEVNQAIQEKERAINEAYAELNREIPRARGEAEEALRAAEGYAIERVNRAKGEADRRRNDPGYYLLASGRAVLEAEIGYRTPVRLWPQRVSRTMGIRGYGGVIVIVAAVILLAPILALSTMGVASGSLAILVVLGSIPALDAAVGLVNAGVTRSVCATCLPALELRDGVPPELRTLVAVPVMLTTREKIEEQIEVLEIHHLASLEGCVHFALLSDWTDASSETFEGDAELLAAAWEGVARLNA